MDQVSDAIECRLSRAAPPEKIRGGLLDPEAVKESA